MGVRQEKTTRFAGRYVCETSPNGKKREAKEKDSSYSDKKLLSIEAFALSVKRLWMR